MANLDRDHYLDKQGLQTLINDLETSIVAEEYSSSTTYALGSYCIYNNLLYRCTTEIDTAEAWNSNHWTQIVLADDVELKTSIQAITTAQWEALSPAEQASGSYVITDATTTPLTAEYVPYDNTTSGLLASDVQDAIDELSTSSGASSVAQLEDVQLSNLSDNDLLVYDSNLTGGKLWKNAKKIVTCTKSQYDTWVANDSFPYTDCKYIVTDVNNINNPTAAEIPYDSNNTASVKDILDLLLDRIYPVGSIYMSVTDSTIEAVQAKFGGTWVRFGAGRTLVGYDSTQTEFDTVEDTGGEKTHTLVPKEMPSRMAAQVRNSTSAAKSTSAVNATWTSVSVAASGTVVTSIYDAGINGLVVWGESETTVGGVSHNNLQPYITVYMYKRTA